MRLVRARGNRAAASFAMAGLVLAALGVAGCSSQPAPSGASVQSCVQFGESAIRQHVTVTTLPPACLGLTATQVDTAVGTALRSTANGVRGKAQQRELIAAASQYLAPMFVAVPAPSGGPSPSTGPGSFVSKTTWGLLALGSWLATVALGLTLFARRALRDRRRRVRVSRPPALNLWHMGLGGMSLLAWIVYLATAVTGVAWAAAGLLPLVAGLGMALLFLSWVAGPARSAAAATVPTADGAQAPHGQARRGRTPVLIVGAHITFATATILFAVLAAIGTG